MPAVTFESTTSQSLCGGFKPRLAHHRNHSATEEWFSLFIHLYPVWKSYLLSTNTLKHFLALNCVPRQFTCLLFMFCSESLRLQLMFTWIKYTAFKSNEEYTKVVMH